MNVYSHTFLPCLCGSTYLYMHTSSQAITDYRSIHFRWKWIEKDFVKCLPKIQTHILYWQKSVCLTGLPVCSHNQNNTWYLFFMSFVGSHSSSSPVSNAHAFSCFGAWTNSPSQNPHAFSLKKIFPYLWLSLVFWHPYFSGHWEN